MDCIEQLKYRLILTEPYFICRSFKPTCSRRCEFMFRYTHNCIDSRKVSAAKQYTRIVRYEPFLAEIFLQKRCPSESETGKYRNSHILSDSLCRRLRKKENVSHNHRKCTIFDLLRFLTFLRQSIMSSTVTVEQLTRLATSITTSVFLISG